MSEPRRFILCALAMAAGLHPFQAVRADDVVYKAVLPSVVWLISPIDAKTQSTGTGTLVDTANRLILTAAHVVGDRPDVVVFFPETGPDGRVLAERAAYVRRRTEAGIRGKVIARDAGRDLALIRIERVPEGARALPLALAPPEPGQTVHAIGNSGEADTALWRYRSGLVRQVYVRTFVVEGQSLQARVVETQAPTNSGDSGGPMVDDRGELVAVTSCHDGGSSLVDYGIEVSECDALLFNGRPLRAVLAAAPVLAAFPWDLGPAAPAAAGPSARVHAVRVVHNIVRNGRCGAEFTLDLTIDGARGHRCELAIVVCNAARRGIRAVNPAYATATGHLAVTGPIVPRFDETRVPGAVLFLPYSEISAAAMPSESSFEVAIDVWSGETGTWLATPPWWEPMERVRR